MEEAIKEELFDKLLMEYSSFVDYTMSLTPAEIIDKSYEKVIKEQLMLMFNPDDTQYDISDIKALNKSKNPLEELYQDWLSADVDIQNILEASVKNTIETLKKEQKNKSMER